MPAPKCELAPPNRRGENAEEQVQEVEEEEADMKTNQKQAKRKGKLHAALTTHRCAHTHTHTHACLRVYVYVCGKSGWEAEKGVGGTLRRTLAKQSSKQDKCNCA